MTSLFRVRRWAVLLALAPPNVIFAQAVIDEVIVTGVPHDRSPTDLAQSVTVIRDETLNRVRSANLGETLSGQLGVSSSYFGAGASRPIIRGLAGARVRTLEDGIDSMDAATVSDDHAVSVEPLVADQIEIFRGPTTLLYGSGAVGGVINTVTTRIPESAPDDGFAGAFE
ncbi:MAG TPA: TonB-dependent receptor plug domain-containing protein, partial [Gammaproteobacteria bacterium]|nr:TonB-dependent receptor plug domain-containing protein [Gammaproteobacteria bacterium]